ncbi:hypothetical protein ABB37_07220 [Leptomonas pyrrhocoris]|uniref:DEK C-terminal domain-containing protein n=1 Tax=Leptomonas pyrrhocoris TaxID=157538 RepID=A0A0M9FWE4_LEPPY|nr:hypothetical protein ABB37_07220 [Leptomonas pyrrhocoris]KPA77339.1 hypothetical protein ABB37_07220 [Leptomonas pyrrhocoris]|eukprot:XP_015655778.1 hypothetical protein ABB37_07220 [Leptomonas pyrrhocoris]
MSDDEPKFDFSEGTGEALGSLPCFTVVGPRSAAGKALETALEPLHRLVYGRPGMSGERRAALEDFKGFPPAMKAEVEEKIGKLTKDRLRNVIQALGLALPISQLRAELVAGVVAFLMAPKDEGKFTDPKAAAPPTKKRRSASPKKAAPTGRKRPAEPSPSHAKTAAAKKRIKKAKPESAEAITGPASTTSSTRSATASEGPSEAVVLVEVYHRVLAMPHEERAVFGVKALRTSLEDHFRLPPGGLQSQKEAITATAADCVRALREAEERAVAALPSATAATATPRTHSFANAEPVEPLAAGHVAPLPSGATPL